MTINYGRTTYNGITLTLQQQPYLDATYYRGRNGDAVYAATAKDAAGNLWRVEWEIISDDCDDESNACEWYAPADAWIIEAAD
jgi:hypothetical protein